LEFTSSNGGRNARFLGWITPTSSGGSYGYDWVATIDARNDTVPTAGYTLAGFGIYTLSALTGGAQRFYGIYLANFSSVGGVTRLMAERGVWNAAAND